jgi:hypothetical protein
MALTTWPWVDGAGTYSATSLVAQDTTGQGTPVGVGHDGVPGEKLVLEVSFFVGHNIIHSFLLQK